VAGELAGLFVTIEGGDGSGKTTQATRLAKRLIALGHDVLATREPGGSPGAEAIRRLVLDPELDVSLCAEILLMYAARFDHVAATIRPALEGGCIVLCDRFTDSTLAYQGYGAGRGAPQVIDLIRSLEARLELRPTLTLVLDVSPSGRRARLAARGQAQDRFEELDADFHQRVDEAFRIITAQDPDRYRLVPGDGPIESVEQRVFAALAPKLP